MDTITNAQLRMIYGLGKRAGLDNDTLHDMAHGMAGVDSLKAMTRQQAARLIDRLMNGARAEAVGPANRATPAQRRKIYALTREMGWDDGRLNAFLARRFGCAHVNFLPAGKVGPVIEALKSMLDGGRAERRPHEAHSLEKEAAACSGGFNT